MVLAAFFVLAWKPQSGRITDLEKQRSAEEIKLQTAKTTLAMLEEDKQNAAETEAELVKLKKQIPMKPKLPEIVDQLQSMANDAGVNLVSIRPSNVAAKGQFGELQINITVEGSYTALVDFLSRIEGSQRTFKTSSIDIKVKSYPDLTMNASLSAFVMESNESSTTAPVKMSAVGTANHRSVAINSGK